MTRLWNAVMAVLGVTSIATATAMVIDNDGSLVNMYSYFTIQSNLLVLISAVLLAIEPDRSGTMFEIVRMAGLVGITVTGVVFATVLEGAIELEGQELWNDRVFHYVIPAMAVIGFLFLRPRTVFHRSAYLFLVWPLAWLVYTLVRAEVADPRFRGENGTTMPVPYDFLDVDAKGGWSVVLSCVVVLLLALAVAWGYRAYGHRAASA
jgi:hypothetical protein